MVYFCVDERTKTMNKPTLILPKSVLEKYIWKHFSDLSVDDFLKLPKK